ncbi:tumor necrosis factor receptor superfamily member 10A isoform X2 [Sapajus apella]|uniref:Tumor necrosis factor receptor superfamily member 10A isoform X2 n=1 Tax=Sapajus apella TaxID=9515 RepID=A0A6J3IR12_SAPAP|nr:tumor necrosis factor receptor superfamily member 10A isoform X2 [Sapajus apella]
MRQRGPCAQAPSRARAGRAPGPRRARGARPGLRVSQTFFVVVVVVGVLLRAVPASAETIIGDDQSPASQQLKHSPLGDVCPPDSYRSEHSGDCSEYVAGGGYTNDTNNLPSCCRPCRVCKSDEVERSPCNRTRNTVCECNPGTFREANSPEMCRKCSTRCPSGMVPVSKCTPESDIRCELKSGNGVVWVILPIFAVILVVAILIIWWIRSGRGRGFKCMDSICSFGWCPLRGPEAKDNDHNEILSNADSLSTFASEEPMESQEPADLTDVIVQTPEEAQSLLRPAEDKGSQRTRMLVLPNGADPTETLRQCFHHFTDNVPFNSWDQLMRELDLTENEICVARAEAAGPRDALYVMLTKWVNKTGRNASIHTLLNALGMLGERHAKERIEDLLVNSGKFIYQEDGTGAAHVSEKVSFY